MNLSKHPVESPLLSEQSNAKSGEALARGLANLSAINEEFMKINLYMIVVALLLFYGIGIMVCHRWFGWNQLDSLYFTVITFTTIGYGDFVPTTEHQQLFTSFFIIVGVAIGGSFIGVYYSHVQEHQERMASARAAIAVQKIQMSSTWDNGQKHFHNAACDDGSKTPAHSGVSITQSLSNFIRSASSMGFGRQKPDDKLKILRKAFIETYDEDLNKLKSQAIRDLMVIMVLVLGGAGVMCAIEGWTFSKAFYWSTQTITTVGYGDVVPNSRRGKVFTICYVLVGCSYMATSVSNFVKYPLVARLKRNEIKVLNQFGGDLSKEKLETIFNSQTTVARRNAHEINKAEFSLLLLQLMNKIDEKDLLLAMEVFDKLDSDGNGCLSRKEMDEKMALAQSNPQIDMRDSLSISQQLALKLGSTFHSMRGRSMDGSDLSARSTRGLDKLSRTDRGRDSRAGDSSSRSQSVTTPLRMSNLSLSRDRPLSIAAASDHTTEHRLPSISSSLPTYMNRDWESLESKNLS